LPNDLHVQYLDEPLMLTALAESPDDRLCSETADK
jgi:hypothetical protein